MFRTAANVTSSAIARRIVLAAAAKLSVGSLDVRLPDGRRLTFGGANAGPRASIAIASDEFFRRVLMHGEIGFGEAYVDGLWRSDDIVALLMIGIENRRHMQFNSSWLAAASRIKNVRLHRANANTRDRAKHNIHAHYDLGNDFFRLFLDETMTYSCAYFAHPKADLADAQRAKYRMLCEKARLSPTDHVLEIGSGWGGFAIFTAQQYGCRVTSITISQEQLELARQRVREAGLDDRVEIRFCDYRDIDGQYDKIVSIEMFEAVGAEYFEAFFRACDRVLRPGGAIAMQTISVPDRSFAALRDGVNWMQKYIFPGGMLPSIAALEQSIARTQLAITALEDIGPHYATTLRRWRERFLALLPAVRALGFDERFVRTWEYYLAASEAGFITRNTQDLQIVLEKAAPVHTIAAAASRDVAEAEMVPA
jgi:cyclopropane-fatty-acyl-phospholipid synthase